MAPNPRVAKAFRAMKVLGIPEEKTKPVLKSLIKIYEKNWELIEEENYRALADAIFDREEAEAEEKRKLANAEAAEKKKKLEQAERMKAIEKETQIEEEPERPLKRLRVRHQDSQASPSCINPSTKSSETLLKKPKLEVDELPEAQPQLRATTAVTESVTRNDSQPVSPLKQGRNKEKQPILEKRSISDKPFSAVRLKEPKVEPGVDVALGQNTLALIIPKNEPLTDEPPRFEVPLAVIMPGSSENMDLSNLVQTTSNETSGRELINLPDESTAELDIASSSSGEIKIFLSCNSAHGNPKLSITSVDSILKKMEDKCLKSYKVLDPNFSVKKLMRDMCEYFLELGPDFSGEPLETCAPDGKCMPSNVNGSLSTNGEVLVSLPEIPKLPSPPDGVGDPLQPVIESTGSDSDKQVEQNGFENAESESLVVVSNNHLTPDDTRSCDEVINDIAKGQESVIISLVTEVNSECPPSFHYIPRNAIFQNAYVNFSLARIADHNCCSTCFGDCLTSSTPCPCALQSGGEFAYTTEGLLKEELLDECIKMNRDPQKRCLVYCKECPLERSKNEAVLKPCKGHSTRSFIKECWLKCGCNKKCGNRVVQCGIKHKLEVFMTSGGKGWGLRTLEDLPKGAFICEYVGEVLTIAELYNRVSQSSNKDEYAHPVLLDADWGTESESKDDNALCLDATYYGNVARFINHRCIDSNLVEIPVEVENPDHCYYHLAFFTTRKVKALEELTRDYGIDFDKENHHVKAFQCQCGSRFCSKHKTHQ